MKKVSEESNKVKVNIDNRLSLMNINESKTYDVDNEVQNINLKVSNNLNQIDSHHIP